MYLAVPEVSATVLRVAVPSLKATLPVGVVVPEAAVTVAVKVMALPGLMLVEEAVRVVVVVVAPGEAVTVMLTAPDVDWEKSVLPVNSAVTESEPTTRVLVEYVATPELLRVALPRLVIPCMKFTVPVGVPSPEVTVAVRVMLVPEAMLLEEADNFVVVTAGVVAPEPLLPPEELLPALLPLPLPPPQPHKEPDTARMTMRLTIFTSEPPSCRKRGYPDPGVAIRKQSLNGPISGQISLENPLSRK